MIISKKKKKKNYKNINLNLNKYNVIFLQIVLCYC